MSVLILPEKSAHYHYLQHRTRLQYQSASVWGQVRPCRSTESWLSVAQATRHPGQTFSCSFSPFPGSTWSHHHSGPFSFCCLPDGSPSHTLRSLRAFILQGLAKYCKHSPKWGEYCLIILESLFPFTDPTRNTPKMWSNDWCFHY